MCFMPVPFGMPWVKMIFLQDFKFASWHTNGRHKRGKTHNLVVLRGGYSLPWNFRWNARKFMYKLLSLKMQLRQDGRTARHAPARRARRLGAGRAAARCGARLSAAACRSSPAATTRARTAVCTAGQWWFSAATTAVPCPPPTATNPTCSSSCSATIPNSNTLALLPLCLVAHSAQKGTGIILLHKAQKENILLQPGKSFRRSHGHL